MRMLVIASLLLTGCATFANTPAQDRTWAAIEKCKGMQPNGYQVTTVYADGRYYYKGGDFAGGVQPWMACIRSGGPS